MKTSRPKKNVRAAATSGKQPTVISTFCGTGGSSLGYSSKYKKISPKSNTIFKGDNLEIMRAMPDDLIDLCYIDPPFFTQRDYKNIWGDKESVLDWETSKLDGFFDTKDFFERHVHTKKDIWMRCKENQSIIFGMIFCRFSQTRLKELAGPPKSQSPFWSELLVQAQTKAILSSIALLVVAPQSTHHIR